MLSVLVYTLSMRAVAEFENVSYATLKKFEVFAMLLSRIVIEFWKLVDVERRDPVWSENPVETDVDRLL